MIVLDKLTKKFDDNIAIKNVNLTFDKQETTVIIGASGSGKSTLIRCINNIEIPTSGSVIIEGKKLTPKNRSKLCLRIGMVFQQFNLFPHMSVLGNLVYGPLTVLNADKIETQHKALNLLEKFSILDKANDFPSSLSGGQKQRVAICRALMMNPTTMLFDEPTSALDPEIIKDVIQIINDLKTQMQMIIISHHIKFAKIIADRIIFMDKGLVLADQPVKEFFTKPSSHRARLFLENVSELM